MIWSDAEIDFLIKYSADLSNIDLSKILGRSTKSISGKALLLKIKKSDDRMVKAKVERVKGLLTFHIAAEGKEIIGSKGFIIVKVGDKWIPKHRHVWECANGKIPKGQVIKLIDGNKHNTELSNLKLITKAELLEMNSANNYPNDLIQAIRLLSKLKKTIERHGKE